MFALGAVVLCAGITFCSALPVSDVNNTGETSQISVILDTLTFIYENSEENKNELEYIPDIDIDRKSFNPELCSTNYFTRSDPESSKEEATLPIQSTMATIIKRSALSEIIADSAYSQTLVLNLLNLFREKVCYDQDYVTNFANYTNCLKTNFATNEENCYKASRNNRDVCKRVFQTTHNQVTCLVEHFESTCGKGASDIITDLYRIKPTTPPELIKLCSRVLDYSTHETH